MYRGKTTFKKILREVGRKTGHQLSARLGGLVERRLSRLESLGVRPLTKDALEGHVPPDVQDMYHDAYHALKSSDKPWATESEIQAILYGDKEMSWQRSSEVIEVLRRAGIKGFKETDEVTTGDIYSERMLGVIGKKEREKEREEQRKRIEKITTRDEQNIGEDRKDADQPIHHGIGPTDMLTLHTTEYQPKRPDLKQSKKTETELPSAQPIQEQSQENKKLSEKKNSSNNNDSKEVPLTFDLDDFDS